MINYENQPMFVVTPFAGSVTWEVRFSHSIACYPGDPSIYLPPAKGLTICTITNQKDSIEYAGQARCSMKDTFSRSTGRKVALAHALTFMHHDVRRAIWNAYWIATGHLDYVSFPTGQAVQFRSVE